MRAHLGCRIVLGITLLVLAPSAQGATLYVASDGTDGAACGGKKAPCRSISQAITRAVAGDKILVGPGVYSGDLDFDGMVGESGEEFPTSGCGCMVGVNKAVTILSTHGAASTVIDARFLDVASNVLLIATGGRFGKPKQGFMVTHTGSADGSGIVIDSDNVTVAGNQVLAFIEGDTLFAGNPYGIVTVDSPGAILIEGNQVMGWEIGIYAQGTNKTIRNNHVSQNLQSGISAFGNSVVSGNVVLGSGAVIGPTSAVLSNGVGIDLNGATRASRNSAYGNNYGVAVDGAFSGVVEESNLAGNGPATLNCGLFNGGVTGLLAATNYWGAATGPGPDPADDVCNNNAGTTTVAPFATKAFKVKASIRP